MAGEEFVHAAYRSILEREADASGFNHHLKRLRFGDRKESILYDIACSPEARTRTSPENMEGLSDGEFINVLYRRMLGRFPDSKGKQYHLSALRENVSRAQVAESIRNSEEAGKYAQVRAQFQQELDVLLKEERRARSLWAWWWRRGLAERRLTRSLHLIEESLKRLMELPQGAGAIRPAAVSGGTGHAGSVQLGRLGGAEQAAVEEGLSEPARLILRRMA